MESRFCLRLDVDLVETQAFRSRIEEGEGEAEVNQLETSVIVSKNDACTTGMRNGDNVPMQAA